MIYPHNSLKGHWDNMITAALLFTCCVTPYRIAFVEEEPLEWVILNWVLDGCFFVDIFCCYSSAFYTEEFQLIDDRWIIAKNYTFSWFPIDVLAIFPFEQIMGGGEDSGGDMNDMVRLARLGRLYKIIRLMKLVRLLKLAKSGSSIFGQIRSMLHISIAFERLMMFTCIFILINHIVACLWIIIAGMEEGDPNSWMSDKYKEMSDT